ncbi:hypothetical protein DCAR_0625045 [Daucus carota subsp. sativus]|uniref:Uncharacterized protein n=1 Tax=Daucus carota subsp. sativus TaxID=79200 RepID=A0AAF0XFW0_DAUCS|nr:hypothetical protein DCAR_0625045 [Daucus carota subsp. sativus]
MGECRPLGFLLGLPFSFLSLILSLLGVIIWILGSLLSCLCPCCFCCGGLLNLAVSLIKLPLNIIRWFIKSIPC